MNWFIKLDFKFNEGKYSLKFRDSLFMLPASLGKLADQFGVESKGIFPYDFVKPNNLNYEGQVPDFKYFKNIFVFSIISIK